jgi:hypothetical protein
VRVEIDQSGKVEWTQKPTVLAFANGTRFSVFISARDKRILLKELEQTKPERSRTMQRVLVFATLLFILLREHIDKLAQVVIDDEYQGHSPTIKEHLLNLLRRSKKRIDPHTIAFQRIGKHSPAHDLAINVFRGTVPASRKLSASEVLAEFRK